MVIRLALTKIDYTKHSSCKVLELLTELQVVDKSASRMVPSFSRNRTEVKGQGAGRKTMTIPYPARKENGMTQLGVLEVVIFC
jgi:hypothetical protein